MKKCPKCGTEVPDDALFCPECGKNLSQTDAAEDAPEAAQSNEAQTPPSTEEPQEPSAPAGESVQGIVCPKCGSADLRIVRFTWWGGLLGAALANQLQCNSCGYKFKISEVKKA